MATPGHPEVPRPRRNSSGLARDLEILELLASGQSLREGGLGVLRIAELTGRDKGAISRAMATLAESGLVARDPATMAYRLGPGLYALAARTSEATLVQRARPLLRRLTQAVRETTHLCVLRGGNVLTLMSELSPHEV
ncbi:MAG TPA: helix-turn-helix domain-containing protein, partial [Candidatus Nanopelagicales bacterium]